MRILVKFWLAVLCLLPVSVFADGNSSFPAQQTFAGYALTLNGTGARSKWMMHLYDAGLYLQNKNNDANAILSADEPMAMRLVITSSMITGDKMEKAVREGFRKSSANLAAIQDRIETLITVFKTGIKSGDVYDFVYLPSSVAVLKNNSPAVSIQGLDFKHAFFGIWLGNNPAQASLKKSLLGG